MGAWAGAAAAPSAAFALEFGNVADLYRILGFGLFGCFMKMHGFQVGPVILGMILGPLMDRWRARRG